MFIYLFIITNDLGPIKIVFGVSIHCTFETIKIYLNAQTLTLYINHIKIIVKTIKNYNFSKGLDRVRIKMHQ